MNKSITLSQITTSIFDGKHGDCENLKGSGLYFISVKDLSDYNINYYNAREITPNDFEQNYKRTNLEEGDTIYANTGDTIGKSIFVKNNKLVSKTSFQKSIAVLKPNINIIEPRYLYYLMKYETPRLRKVATGSGQKNLLLSTMRDFKVTIHDRKRQKQICSLLGLLDDKIEINNKINDELENMAKTIYDYWFLQFEFPNEEGKPYKSSGGKMVWNEVLKREIPEGWEVKTLYDIADYINGLACQKYRPINKDNILPVIKIVEMHNGITSNTEYVRDDIPLKNIIDTGDILFSWSASLEVTLWKGKKAGLNQHIFKVVPKFYPKYYIYMQLSAYIINFIKIAETRKTTMGHITIDHLKQSKILLPNIKLAKTYDIFVKDLFEKILLNNIENQELTSLRDFLLPLLMNGQVGFKGDKAEG